MIMERLHRDPRRCLFRPNSYIRFRQFEKLRSFPSRSYRNKNSSRHYIFRFSCKGGTTGKAEQVLCHGVGPFFVLTIPLFDGIIMDN